MSCTTPTIRQRDGQTTLRSYAVWHVTLVRNGAPAHPDHDETGSFDALVSVPGPALRLRSHLLELELQTLPMQPIEDGARGLPLNRTSVDRNRHCNRNKHEAGQDLTRLSLRGNLSYRIRFDPGGAFKAATDESRDSSFLFFRTFDGNQAQSQFDLSSEPEQKAHRSRQL